MRRMDIQALALSDKETAVLETLRASSSPRKISHIAQTTGLPHSTTSFVLRLLEKRKLARRIKEANHFSWEYRDTLGLVENDSGIETANLSVGMGMQRLAQEFVALFKSPHAQRLYVIQGAGVARDILRKIDPVLLKALHEESRKKKVIIEGVISESVLDLFGSMSLEQLESHKGRMTIVHVLPDSLIDFPLDVFIYGRSVLLVDYGKERLIKAEVEGMSDVFRSLFFLAEQQGRRISLDQHLEALIAKKKKGKG